MQTEKQEVAMQTPTKWTWEEDKVFENALVQIPEGTPDRCHIISEKLPANSAKEIELHYHKLVFDVNETEASNIEFPDYADASTRGTSGREKNGQNKKRKRIPWTEEEHRLFLRGLEDYSGDWKHLSRHVVRTKTPTQIASHAQKFFNRQKQTERKRSSIHDITTFGDDDDNPSVASEPEPLHMPDTSTSMSMAPKDMPMRYPLRAYSMPIDDPSISPSNQPVGEWDTSDPPTLDMPQTSTIMSMDPRDTSMPYLRKGHNMPIDELGVSMPSSQPVGEWSASDPKTLDVPHTPKSMSMDPKDRSMTDTQRAHRMLVEQEGISTPSNQLIGEWGTPDSRTLDVPRSSTFMSLDTGDMFVPYPQKARNMPVDELGISMASKGPTNGWVTFKPSNYQLVDDWGTSMPSNQENNLDMQMDTRNTILHDHMNPYMQMDATTMAGHQMDSLMHIYTGTMSGHQMHPSMQMVASTMLPNQMDPFMHTDLGTMSSHQPHPSMQTHTSTMANHQTSPGLQGQLDSYMQTHAGNMVSHHIDPIAIAPTPIDQCNPVTVAVPSTEIHSSPTEIARIQAATLHSNFHFNRRQIYGSC